MNLNVEEIYEMQKEAGRTIGGLKLVNMTFCDAFYYKQCAFQVQKIRILLIIFLACKNCDKYETFAPSLSICSLVPVT